MVDPFNIIHTPNTIDESKEKISRSINYPLYKLPEYGHKLAPIVLLGDSRTRTLDASIFEKYLGKPSFNLAYGGGTLDEMVSNFWHIVTEGKITQIFIGINLDLLGYNNTMNRVPEAI